VTKNPGFIMANVFGRHDGEVSFHMSLNSQALHKTPTAAKEYYDWVIQLCKDWDFDNMATAHGGVLLGGSKEALLAGLEKAKPGLIDVAVKNGGPFHFLGLIDVGTHMTFLKLSSGKFLTLSTVDLDPEAKAEVDTLTQNGSLIEAVVATNPFHTLAFEAFYAAYGKGKDVKFYGTPRHLRKYPGIPWAGSVEDEKILKLWEKDVDLRIPAGCEFNNPQPESYNHFCGV
ncbi:hypothetical protein HDU99_009086, partial [Rhizoclosmatium hyalinum]